ncbi:hypothetical protein TPHA_0J00460 [Tetrapisispora phaffii CBS 4417]|uniref:Coenzyme Q-binding protein COQ10 START domain-containing protein n=1 Tax=Tetrapisispora phaffii (strain ATCC 24235 / CBS 4417 / NBRC 1672 / NRRL Y-8282 / UCD 70-5) TaxID=1071381 RepID=G8BYC7_TETPH|nr:hypothetical protein TPHA_0J00460 [Tetrapisispora phaffii CBS 4417]CCE64869.1 hypothetical protein TPHA_0J00460 [Tetrapisispora phaffii CBS 4417]
MLKNIGKRQLTFRRCLFGDGLKPKEQTFVYKRKINSNTKLLYDVISNVKQYQEFIPYCKESFVNKSDKNGLPSEAGLRVGFQKYDDKFTCNVLCEDKGANNYNIVTESISHNLFYFLYGKWTITPLRNNKQSDLELELKYKFRSPIYNAVSSIFAKSATSLVLHAFEKRVYEIIKKSR